VDRLNNKDHFLLIRAGRVPKPKTTLEVIPIFKLYGRILVCLYKYPSQKMRKHAGVGG
jgi:hypothetical protein